MNEWTFMECYALGFLLLGVMLALLFGWCIRQLFKQGAANKLKGLIGLGVCIAVCWLNLEAFEFAFVMVIADIPHLLKTN
jgi:hypothetical protein